MILSVLKRRTLSDEEKDELLLPPSWRDRPNPNPALESRPGLARRLAEADADRRDPAGWTSGSSACEVLSDVADSDASTSVSNCTLSSLMFLGRFKVHTHKPH